MTDDSKQLAALTAKVKELEAKITPTPYPDDAALARFKDEMHQLAERRASGFNAFTKEQLTAFREAGPNTQAIVHDQRNAPTGPTGIIPRDSNVQSGPVRTGTGWQHYVPLRNGLGGGK